MLKKILIFGCGAALVGALLFGTRLMPYAKTTIKNLRDRAKDAVPISVQIDTARDQLQSVDREIRNMMLNVAKEEVGIRSVAQKLELNQAELNRQYSHIMRLKEHLDSGEVMYTSAGRNFSNDRVRDDLSSLFRVYKTSEKTCDDLKQTLQLRQQGLDAAKAHLEETIAQRRELAVEIENLSARKQMVDVAKTASRLELDDSELAEARAMIDEISSRIEVEAQMLQLVPHYLPTTCIDGAESPESENISAEIEAYFGSKESADVAQK